MTLNIGIDAHVITGKFQGSRTYLLNLLRHLGQIDQTNRYRIYSFDPDITRALLPFDNFEHVPLAVHAAIPRLLFYWPWEQFRQKLDFLLTSYFCPLLYPKRQIVIIHDLLFESHPQYFTSLAALRFKTLVRLSAVRAGAVIAVSQTTRADIVARYKIPQARVHLVRGGIDPSHHAPDTGGPSPHAQPYVLAVGRLEPRKNIATLLQAFRLMRTPAHLVVIGREDFGAADVAAELRAMQTDTATQGRITWLTGVTDGELPGWYRHAAVFAFPSYAEGFGIPVLEALAHGTPVVTSTHAALREIGGSLARSFHAEAPDAAGQLAAELDAAIAEDRQAGAEARAAHARAFDWNRSAEAFLTLIGATASSGG
jgi:glycosyltransferase involved in cell wall biosynthesis